MTDDGRQRVADTLRTRLDGYWWTALPQPTIKVVITRGPGDPEATIRALRNIDPAPRIELSDEEQITLAAWRSASWGCSSDVVSVISAGWSPPPDWLVNLARHLSDGATFAIAGSPDRPDGAAMSRVDWRTPGASRRLADVPVEGALVRPEHASAANDRRGLFESLIEAGGTIVLDHPRFTRHTKDRTPVPEPPRTGPSPGGAFAGLVSVVVPTIPRRAAELQRCLASIRGQDLPQDQIEVLVVPNGPGSRGMRRPRDADRVLPVDEPSAAAARNHGARHARGQLLVFVDDDVVLTPGSLRAHLSAQTRAPSVTIGPYYPPTAPATLAEQTAFRWWHGFLARMTRPGHRVTFVDVLTGNMGMPPALFAKLGGFDESSRSARREDWEFGYRVLSAGVPVSIIPEARARHAYTTSPRRIVHDAEREGFGDVVIVERYPEIFEDLPLRRAADRPASGSVRWRTEVALGRVATGRLAAPAMLLLAALERTGRRRQWLRLVHLLSGAAYRSGMQRAIDDGHRLPPTTRFETRIELSDPSAANGPAHLGRIVVTLDDEEITAFHPHSGQWDVEEIIERCLERWQLLEDKLDLVKSATAGHET